jgi:citrate lyase subunit beta/citryl-CoA lyase
LIHRSFLFVPGNRPERFAKAAAAGADAVIIDLEDAVAPPDKPAARAAVAAWLSPDHPAMVRINGAGTPWFQDDLSICRQPGVSGVVIPKAEQADDLRIIADAVAADVPLLPIVETGAGIWNAEALARQSKVARLIFGSIDLQADLGVTGENRELLYFRSHLVLVSRVAGRQPPVDGVTTAIDSTSRLQLDTIRAKRLGFGGKLCIQPKQVSVVNASFQPTDAEVAWAQRITDAMAAAQGSAVAVDGQMVDEPVLLRAKAILAARK